MLEQMLQIFGYMLLISLTAFTGTAQALFYEIGVERTHWVTAKDFSTFLGFGFASPGPQVFTAATFIGYGAGGFVGALIGTLAIFLAPCVLAILAGRYLRHWVHGERAGYFIQAVGLAAAGMLIAVGISLLRANPVTLGYGVIASLSFLAVARWKINPFFVVLIGGLIGTLIA